MPAATFVDCRSPYALHFYFASPSCWQSQIPVRHLVAASCLLIATLHCEHNALYSVPPPSCCSLSSCCSASFVLLVDIPMEFQFPEQPDCSIDSICFAQESMLRFLVESFNALECDKWYAICAVILKRTTQLEDLWIFVYLKKYKYLSGILSREVFALCCFSLPLQMH